MIPLFLCELCPFKLRILPKLVINNVISATPLKLPIWFLRNLICSKEILFSCVYYQEILIPIFWGVMSFELRILPKLLINNCKRNCFETLQLTARGETCFCLKKQTLIFNLDVTHPCSTCTCEHLDFMKNEIFIPCGMNNTYILDQEKVVPFQSRTLQVLTQTCCRWIEHIGFYTYLNLSNEQ